MDGLNDRVDVMLPFRFQWNENENLKTYSCGQVLDIHNPTLRPATTKLLASHVFPNSIIIHEVNSQLGDLIWVTTPRFLVKHGWNHIVSWYPNTRVSLSISIQLAQHNDILTNVYYTTTCWAPQKFYSSSSVTPSSAFLVWRETPWCVASFISAARHRRKIKNL